MIIILAALLLFQVGCIDSLDISPEELKSTNLEQKSIQVGSNDMQTYQAQLISTQDGWNGNTLLIKQGMNTILELGKDFKKGTYYPIYFKVTPGVSYQVTTGYMARIRTQIMLKIKDSNGKIKFSFGPRKSYKKNDVLGKFTVGKYTFLKQSSTQDQQEIYLQEQEQGQVENSVLLSNNSAIVVAIVCLSALSIVLLVSLIVVMLKLTKKDKKIIGDTLGSASNFKADENAI